MIDLKKPILSVLIVVMVCMFQIMILPALAQYTCGLQSGKYARYDWSITGSSMGQSYSISGTLDMNIQSVTGTSYSGTSKFAVTGGSLPTSIFTVPQTNQTFSGDVGSGYGSTGFLGLVAIPANMTAASNIPNVGSVQQIGSWSGRSAVVINSSGLILGQGNAYYDQTTGIFMYSKTTLAYQGVYSFDLKVEMVGTDLWSGGFGGGLLGLDPWIWIVIIIIIVAAVAAVAVLMLARRKKPPTTPKQTTLQQPPPPPPPPA
jgi:hypothetical protein